MNQLGAVVATAVGLGTLLSATAAGASGDSFAVRRQNTLAAFKQAHPSVRFHEDFGRIARVYGRPFSTGDSPEASAERFRTQYAEMLGAEAADLDSRGPLKDERHTLLLMPDPQTGGYKFTLVYYTQRKNGIPVFRSDLRLLVRNEPDYPLVLAASSLRDLGEFTLNPAALQADPDRAHAAARAAVAGLGRLTAPEPVIWAGLEETPEPPVAAVKFIGYEQNGPQKWMFIAEAATGRILYHEDLLRDVDVSGNVSAMATEGSGAEHCEAEVLTGMPYARVNIGGNFDIADFGGNFLIPNPGTAPVTVQSPVRGPYFEVFDFLGTPTSLSQMVTPPGPADFVHNLPNTEFTRAQVNAYIHANVVRDFILEHSPSYPTLPNQSDYPVWVNRTDGFCPGNAWYDPVDVSINFCRTGGGSPNTAWSSVIYHEFGHSLVDAGGSGQGQYGEGTGDVISLLVLDESYVGIGFFGSCLPGDALRNAQNDLQYPCDGAIHFCGQLISGCVWSTRIQLAGTNPGNYMDILAPLAINAILLHSGSSISPDITIDYLTLDDNDNNLDNGTPHSTQICAGFGAHNMDCPPFDAIGFTYPEGRPATVLPNTPATIRVNVVPIVGAPQPNTGQFSYRIGNGSFTTVPMTQLSPNQYEANLPGIDCNEIVTYYFSATAQGGAGTFTDPPNAPSSTFSLLSAIDLVTVADYDFEVNPGWTVSNSGGLTDGAWQRGVPAGDGDRGDPLSDFDGSGSCWLTDNTPGNSDVDNGTTTLTSNLFDLSDGGTVSYAYWFNDISSGALNGDSFTVSMATNAGSTNWQVLRTYTTAASNWRTDSIQVGVEIPATSTMRIRFAVGDLGTQNVVEAGLDAFKAVTVDCTPCAEPCDDGNACTINDVCVGLICAGTPVDCSGIEVDQCNIAVCNPAGAEGNCDAIQPVVDFTDCDDGQACHVNERCFAGVCTGGGPVNCSNAGGPCNTAACNAAGAEGNCSILTPVTNGISCDVDPCIANESCQAGSCVGGAPHDCSASDQECHEASCNPSGPSGNCSILTPRPDGSGCDEGAGVCDSGECVPDPGDNRVFMATPGGENLVPLIGASNVTIAPGSSTLIKVWAADTEPQMLGAYQIAVPGVATPQPGAAGSVSYVNTAGSGGSVFIDTSDPQWVFSFDPSIQPAYSETGLPQGFAMLAAAPLGSGSAVTGPGYLGEFALAASPEAKGTFLLDFLPLNAPPNGGSALADESGVQMIPAVYQPLQIVVQPGLGCTDTADCADLNSNGIRDDSCVWSSCESGNCNDIDVIFGDVGGSFGTCPPDGFTNLFDRNHVLTCFAGNNVCDPMNIDIGGSFGSCTPDGFCNLFDATHTLTAFEGTSACSCPAGAAPQAAAQVVAEAALIVRPDRHEVGSGEIIEVRVYIEQPLADLQGYQLHLDPSGGRRGALELLAVDIEPLAGAAFDPAAPGYQAFNAERGQMLAGLDQGGVPTPAGAYLATYRYRASRDAAGTFVIDVRHDESAGDQSFLVSNFSNKIAIKRSMPAVVRVLPAARTQAR